MGWSIGQNLSRLPYSFSIVCLTILARPASSKRRRAGCRLRAARERGGDEEGADQRGEWLAHGNLELVWRGP
jgi:hypothetical protein